MNSYAEHTYWKKYLKYLPKELWYNEDNLPFEEFWKWKNFNIHLDKMINPDSQVRVIILHGAGGNGRIVSLLGNFLNALLYEYIAPDLIGYGLTENPQHENIKYDDWVDCISDLVDFEVKKDNRPIILLGLSIGGMLAYQIAAKNENIKGIIVTTLADPRSIKVKDDLARNIFFSRVGIPLIYLFTFFTDGLKLPVKWLCKMDRITNDKAFSKVFSNDKLAGGSKMSLKFLRTYLSFKPALEPENFTTCEVLYLHPEKDKWTLLETSKPFYDRITSEKRMVLLQNCGHAPYEEPGLTVMKNEIINFLNKYKF